MDENFDRRAMLFGAGLGAGGLASGLASSAAQAAPTSGLELRLERAEAAHAVQNLMGRYSFLHTAAQHEASLDCFAMKTPSVRVEMMWGVYVGPESLRRLYPGFHVWADGDGVGRLHIHTMTTPVVEVAGDGRTAKGVWVSPGIETGVFGPDGKISANWGWMKYGADFLKEDGVWKIWHLHVFGLFLANYYKSWIDKPDDMKEMPMPERFKPDRPPTTHWEYMIDRKPELVPAPPKPYYSFDETTAF